MNGNTDRHQMIVDGAKSLCTGLFAVIVIGLGILNVLLSHFRSVEKAVEEGKTIAVNEYIEQNETVHIKADQKQKLLEWMITIPSDNRTLEYYQVKEMIETLPTIEGVN